LSGSSAGIAVDALFKRGSVSADFEAWRNALVGRDDLDAAVAVTGVVPHE